MNRPFIASYPSFAHAVQHTGKFLLILFLQCLLIRPDCQAQNVCHEWFIKTYGSKEGLPDTEQGILQKDPRGFLWIGGNDGLSRFDGRSFTHFNTLDGLQSNTITDIKSDTAGFLYVATPGAIHRYTGSRPAFQRYGFVLPARCKVICPADSSRIWIGLTGRDTLFQWEKGKMKKIPVNGAVEWLEQDGEGYLYALTNRHQLYILMDGQVKLRIGLPHPEAVFRQLYKDDDGKVWYTGTNYVYRLSSWGLADSIPLPYGSGRRSQAGRYSIANNTLLYLKNDCWETVLTLPASDNGYEVKGIEKDKAGRYWLLSQHNLLHLYPKTYEHISYPSPDFYFMKSPTGRTILEKDSSADRSALHAAFFKRLKQELTNAYQGRDGTVWYLTQKGLYYVLPGSSLLKVYAPSTGSGAGLHFIGAREDGKGGTWLIATRSVHYFRDGRFTDFPLPSLEEDMIISNSAIDQKGRLFLAVRKLYIFDQGSLQELPLPAGLPDRPIAGITSDPEKNLWVWTDSSVLYKMGMDVAGHLTISDSFEVAVNGQASIPRAVEFDQNGNLWVAARQELHIFLRLAGGIFSTAHQLVLSGEQRIGELTKDRCQLFPGKRRDMYLQNGSALYRFDAKDVIQGYYRKTPDIYFSGIEFSYSQQNGQHKQIAIPVAGRLPFLQLPATSHSLSISYTALCPEAPDHIMYRYRLVGVDDGWRPITRSETANYNGIGSGEYLFMVQAANASGLWSEPARYTFSIGPDWYERPLAQMLWVMLSIVIILVLAYYVLLMRSQKKELENMLIDQQLKTLRAQINPHFLQNSFEFLAQHIRVGDHEKSINIIHRIARYFRHILYKSDESIVTLEAELESIDEYLSLKKMILHNSFHCSIHIADEVDTIGVMVPCLVLQPLVENAVKYGLDSISHKGHIEIDVQQDEHYVHVSITDSGCRQRVNTPQKEGRQSKGIALTQKRLELLYQRHKHRPSVEMTPLPDRGTKVMVNIPLF